MEDDEFENTQSWKLSDPAEHKQCQQCGKYHNIEEMCWYCENSQPAAPSLALKHKGSVCACLAIRKGGAMHSFTNEKGKCWTACCECNRGGNGNDKDK